jgi:hypothetical protein
MSERTLPVLTHPEFPQVFTKALEGMVCPPCDCSAERYIAVVVRVDNRFGGVVSASTNFGNLVSKLLPEGAHVTRSIEITKDMAQRSW